MRGGGSSPCNPVLLPPLTVGKVLRLLGELRCGKLYRMSKNLPWKQTVIYWPRRDFNTGRWLVFDVMVRWVRGERQYRALTKQERDEMLQAMMEY